MTQKSQTPKAGGKSEWDRFIDEIVFFHDSRDQILKSFRQTADVLQLAFRKIRALEAEVAAIKRGEPLNKALRTQSRFTMSGEEFLAKALEAQRAGRLTGAQVGAAEIAINAGRVPPASIVRAVLKGEPA